MSEENSEVVRRYFAAYDSGGLDAVAEFWHPDIEWRAVEGYLEESGRTEIEELIEAGDQVIALLRGVGRMKQSDAEIDIRYAVLISIRDGKIARGREYSTPQEALEAAGLSE